MAGAPSAVTCAICGRSLLVGERPIRFSPDGMNYVDVCPLCRERALEYGWHREGGAVVPVRPPDRRRGFFGRIFQGPVKTPPAVTEPVLERLTGEEQVAAQAASLFNSSSHRRTVEGLVRSLGAPRASVVRLSGVNPEVVLTFCWDISWYQYRIVFEGEQPVQLAERGYDPSELKPPFTAWNATVDDGGLISPALANEAPPSGDGGSVRAS